MKFRSVYLVLAIVGAVIPYVFFMQHFRAEGFGVMTFINALFVNGAAGGFSSDLLVSSLVFWVGMFEMHRRHNGPAPWAFIGLNLVIGLSFALPLYLFVRHMTRDDAGTVS